MLQNPDVAAWKVMHAVALGLVGILGISAAVFDGIVVYSLFVTSVGQEWIPTAVLYLLVVVITPISAGFWSKKHHRGPGTKPLRLVAVVLLVGGIVVGFLLLPAFSM